MSIDNCLHSVFGASKLAADVMCQEFGRYFQMPVGIFRGGCLTGPQHAGVELHGYLSYIIDCAMTGREYVLYGYKGKQVRDQIHSYDVAQLFLAFFGSLVWAKCSICGGCDHSLSILETVELLAKFGLNLNSYTRIKTESAIISAIFQISLKFIDFSPNGNLPMICRRSSWKWSIVG